MNETTLTPEESLLLIRKTIEETKERFKENGHIFILWGVLMFTVFFSQYIFSITGLYKKFDIICTVILFPLGAIYTFIYVKKEKKKNMPKTLIGDILETIGWVVGANLGIMGFFFSNKLGDAMAPVFLILLAFMIVVSGTSIKFKPLIIGGVLLNVIGLGSFLVSRDYHGFSMMLGAVVGMIIPGILLNKARRKEHV